MNPRHLDIDVGELDLTLMINLRAAFILTKLAMPSMTERQWGRYIYIGSLVAYGGGVNGCHYAARKAGLQGMMRHLARQHARDGITANNVAPAMIDETGIIPDEKAVTPGGDVREIPVGRLETPQEVAGHPIERRAAVGKEEPIK